MARYCHPLREDRHDLSGRAPHRRHLPVVSLMIQTKRPRRYRPPQVVGPSAPSVRCGCQEGHERLPAGAGAVFGFRGRWLMARMASISRAGRNRVRGMMKAASAPRVYRARGRGVVATLAILAPAFAAGRARSRKAALDATVALMR